MGERLRWGSWDYAERGPARWAGLSEEYAACERGHEQSPLALVTPDVGGTPEALELHYGEVRVDLTDNGHTVLVPTAGGSYAVVGGERYFLFQIHFHAPSEHTIDGREHPMEIHLVHRTRAQQLFVLGVPVASGAPNAALAALFAHLPERGHLTADLRFDPARCSRPTAPRSATVARSPRRRAASRWSGPSSPRPSQCRRRSSPPSAPSMTGTGGRRGPPSRAGSGRRACSTRAGSPAPSARGTSGRALLQHGCAREGAPLSSCPASAS